MGNLLQFEYELTAFILFWGLSTNLSATRAICLRSSTQSLSRVAEKMQINILGELSQNK